MTQRTPLFDTEEIELLFSEVEDPPAMSATAALPGAFAARLPRGVEIANVDGELAVVLADGTADDDRDVLDDRERRESAIRGTNPSSTSPYPTAPRSAGAGDPPADRAARGGTDREQHPAAARGASSEIDRDRHPAAPRGASFEIDRDRHPSAPRGANPSLAPAAGAPPADPPALRGADIRSTAAASQRDLPSAFSPDKTVMASPENLRLALAFDHLELELARLGHRWEAHAPRGRIDAIANDFAAYMRILLEDVELEPIYTRSAETSLLVHDTYVRLITVGGVLREAMESRWANAADLASAYAHVEALLDAFTPFVGLADRAMRRICLGAETLEGALRWLSRQLDEEAAERLRAAEAFVPPGIARARYRNN